MPFRSEKQRRFLWAEHPEIAKRWAHKYPESNKGLPMYAGTKSQKDDKDTEKEAALSALSRALTVYGMSNLCQSASILGESTKEANSGLLYVKVPQNEKPTYAGEEATKLEGKTEGDTGCAAPSENSADKEIASVFGKLALVLAKPLREEKERRDALLEGRDPRHVPQNMMLQRLTMPAPQIQPPMGMTAPPAPQPQQQPQQQPSNGPVGGGSNPQHNPIQAFGGLGAKGQLNGNAAFGMKNSPDSLKTALAKWANADEDNLPERAYPYNQPDYATRLSPEKLQAFNAFWTDNTGYGDIIAATRALDRQARKGVPEKDWHKLEDSQAEGAGYMTYKNIQRLMAANKLPVNDQFTLQDWQQLYSSPETAKHASDSGAWTRAEGKNPEGGLNAKGRASLKAQGHDIKPPVTESNPKGDRAKRQNSFCARMCGMKRHETGSQTKKDPDSRINKSLRKWNCKCSSAQAFGEKLAAELSSGAQPQLAPPQPVTSGSRPLAGGLSAAPKPTALKSTAPKQPAIGGIFGRGGYAETLDRWYNPNTTQQVTDPTEKSLMRVGQGALGAGAAAGATAAGLIAAAPTLGSTAVSALPAYFAGNAAASGAAGAAGAGGVAAANNPGFMQNLSRAMPTFANTASRAGQFGSAVANKLNNAGADVALRANDLKSQFARNLPRPIQSASHWYHHNIAEPIENSAFAGMTSLNPGGPGFSLNPALTRGDPAGLIPHSVGVPYELAHGAMHALPFGHGAEH